MSNSISFLQVQDGALASVGKILDRMSELKTMSLDVTKNSLDIANYDAEFNQLQDQLANIREEKFNGINLFTSDVSAPSPLTTYSTETGDGVTKTTTQQVDTLTISAGTASAGVNTINVDVDGNVLAGAVDHTGDNAATATALAAAINADGTSALVTADASADGTMTLIAVNAGTAFTASSTVAGDVTSSSSTTTSLSTSVDQLGTHFR